MSEKSFKNSKIKEESTSNNIDKTAHKLLEINVTDTEQKVYEGYLNSLVRDKASLDIAKTEKFKKGFIEEFRKGKRIQQESTITIGYKNDLSINLLAKLTGLTEVEVISILKKAGLYKDL